jgi:hypothetical protein
MTWADNINGLYETIGGLFMLANCIKVYKDKEVKGISLVSCVFFCTWGYWNLYYYPSLDQWMNTIGAALLTLFNTIWIGQAIYYTRKKKQLKDAIAKMYGNIYYDNRRTTKDRC